MQKNIFEIGLRDSEVLHVGLCQTMEQVGYVALIKEMGNIIELLHLGYSFQFGFVKHSPDAHLLRMRVHQCSYAVACHYLSLADDCRPRAVMLHIGEDMARHENRSARLIVLFQQAEKRMLHQGVQPAGGLIKNQQFGLMLHSGYDAHFLAVAKRQLRNATRSIKLELLAEVSRLGFAICAMQSSCKLQGLLNRLRGIEMRLRRQVTH